MNHDSSKCRDCAELGRFFDVFCSLGANNAADVVMRAECPQNGGEPIEETLGAAMEPLAKHKVYGPGGPPVFDLTTTWKRFGKFTADDAETALKVVRSTDDLKFMRNAVETVVTFVHTRMEDLNAAKGLNRDGTVRGDPPKREEPPPMLPPEKEPPAGVVKHTLSKLELAKARVSGNYFQIQHSTTSGNKHSYTGQRGAECPLCKSMPLDVMLLPMTAVNRHGNRRANSDVKPIYERWEGGR